MSYPPMQLAEIFIKTGELDDALQALNEHLQAAPQDADALRLRAALLLRLGGPPYLRQALADLSALPEQGADDAVQRSRLYEELGDTAAAIHTMQQACQQHPQLERLQERLLGLLIGANSLDEALALVRSQPRNWRWLQWEGDLLVLARDDAAAASSYTLALEQIEQREILPPALAAMQARILLARGHARRRLLHLQAAEQDYAEAGRILPGEPTIPFYRGLLLAGSGETQAALDLCRSALAAVPPALREELLRAVDDPALAQQLMD